MYEFWEGVQQNHFKAKELYTKAFDMKEERGYKHTQN
jgi:TPR repeat protein